MSHLFERPGNGTAAGSGVSTAVWAPPRARLAAPVDFARVQHVEVHVFQDAGGPQLRAAIELASPANKDRPRSRLTFAAKRVGYLERGVGLVVLDTVTTARGQPACGNRRGGSKRPRTSIGIRCHLWRLSLTGRWPRTARRASKPGPKPSRLAPSCRHCCCGWGPTSACRCLWKTVTPLLAIRSGLRGWYLSEKGSDPCIQGV